MPAPRPTPAAIRRAIEAMQAAGLTVGGLRILRDGSVMVLRDITTMIGGETLDRTEKSGDDGRKPEPWT